MQNWFDMREESRNLSAQAVDQYNAGEYQRAIDTDTKGYASEKPLQELKAQEFKRGKDPKNRATECGRAWSEGDGF